MLDTNICIYIINENPARVKEVFLQHNVGEIGLSAIVVAELFAGSQKSKARAKNLAALEKFLTDFELVPFDADAAERFGEISAELEGKGMKIGPYDTQIAAHALQLNATLITNDSEFSRVKGLKIENWF
jgi:tRNA(fMet)-specific endonuclease VapC